MKKAIIIHGWGGSPEEPMHQWIKKQLEERGYEVIAPEMPNADEPEIEAWIGKLKEVTADINSETILIGHSIGCQTILRYMERLPDNFKVRKCILVAPWMQLDEETIKEEGPEAVAIAKPWIEISINWEKIKSHCDKFICIFSDNDSFVPLSDMKIFEKEIGAEILLLSNRGHFDPDSGIKDLPEILQFID